MSKPTGPKSIKKITKRLKSIPLELSEDSSDEDVQVKIGDVPTKWYEGFKHIGYDATANKVMKDEQNDKLDSIINRAENPNWWRTIRDELNNDNLILTDEQLMTLERIRSGHGASRTTEQGDYYFEYDHDSRFSLNTQPYLPKKAFLPSKWERMHINRLVVAIRNGWIKLDAKKKEPEEEKFWDIWENTADDQELARKMPPVLSAPKLKLPGHAESYNPSEEYLFSKEELKEWKEADPTDREQNFIPKKYDCLRKVEAYEGLVKERFERCLDLYLCPRLRRKKLNIDPNSLLPSLPKPSDLRPFPTSSNIIFKGHSSWISALDTNQNGQYLCSCERDGVFMVWDTKSSRTLQRIAFEGELTYLCWSKTETTSLIALCNDKRLHIINPKFGTSQMKEINEQKLLQAQAAYNADANHVLEWNFLAEEDEKYKEGVRIVINFENEVKHVAYHAKGDYFATVSPRSLRANDQVFVHSLSKGISQRPFTKSKGNIVQVTFHSTKPILFVLTHQNAYLYDLQKQALTKKLVTGSSNNFCMNLHPGGDNIIIGTSDMNVCWFDLDIGSKPYKVMQYHSKAVRQVAYHETYPLFATASDDGTVNIFHGMVYTSLLQNALILPLKILKGHKATKDWGVSAIVFHPKQPWIFSAGVDNTIILWT